MSRRIQDRIGPFYPIDDGTESGLLGVNGDAVLPLHLVVVQVGVPGIHSSHLPDGLPQI